MACTPKEIPRNSKPQPMKSYIRFRVPGTAVLIGAMLIAVPSIRAESLTILNHSFENGVMDAANRYGTTSDWEVGG